HGRNRGVSQPPADLVLEPNRELRWRREEFEPLALDHAAALAGDPPQRDSEVDVVAPAIQVAHQSTALVVAPPLPATDATSPPFCRRVSSTTTPFSSSACGSTNLPGVNPPNRYASRSSPTSSFILSEPPR